MIRAIDKLSSKSWSNESGNKGFMLWILNKHLDSVVIWIERIPREEIYSQYGISDKIKNSKYFLYPQHITDVNF